MRARSAERAVEHQTGAQIAAEAGRAERRGVEAASVERLQSGAKILDVEIDRARQGCRRQRPGGDAAGDPPAHLNRAG